jgi:hypothetical protein
MDIRFKRLLLEKLTWHANIKKSLTYQDIVDEGYRLNVNPDGSLIRKWIDELFVNGFIVFVGERSSYRTRARISFGGIWHLYTLGKI